MLRGQWTGPFAGSGSGDVIVEFDRVGDEHIGSVTVFSSEPNAPITVCWLSVPFDLKEFDQRLPLRFYDFRSNEPVEAHRLVDIYSGAQQWPKHADTKWRLSTNTLYLSWELPNNTHGLAVLNQGNPRAPSVRVPLTTVDNWTKFKEYATSIKPYRYFFRGHSDNKWRLRTYFHRTGRADLRRFMTMDIPALHRLLSGLTTHFFNLSNPIENGAFYALAQHHGYPTPLLDWTQSPFVAAYFAYRTLPKEQRTDQHKVRIIILDAKMWGRLPQLSVVAPARKHMSILAPVGIENTRLVPQQAYLTISNVDDIEGYIAEVEEATNTKFLDVIDLPGSERQLVMTELAMMGITAGSMFPGLDGACEQLREQNFDL
jgi:hypothetical protein